MRMAGCEIFAGENSAAIIKGPLRVAFRKLDCVSVKVQTSGE
jgi:hypothetical protein